MDKAASSSDGQVLDKPNLSDRRSLTPAHQLLTKILSWTRVIAKTENIELQRLRRQVAFDRFLARLFQTADTQWVLKGGYAMELRFQIARATKDLNFTLRTVSTQGGDAVLGYLQETGRRDLNDFFSFRVGAPMMDLALILFT